ncbi:TraR/DksA family transcriptional regulator [Flavobacterium cellulosilyticum]|uniref:TraR/DksA family transcriptional regulator n=1 Tax=Flavobacterium cellulosilyticum TaxID=2541731 RepID=A0A4R5CFX5_9FLAO|nr:TraR/DksA C4-type zinc finger protein [Flavobacterium cellulosilyticum]TDD96154.1 TraR/DksA family transcriptional regulator [Flavobacterium cellulosilyticum]
MKKTTDEIRLKVVAEIEKTEKTITKLEELSKPVTSTDAIGHVSRMNSINNDTVLAIPLNNAKIKLASLNKVMAQIGTDDFGKCLKCHKPIALGRILFRPQSLLCIKCAK